MMPMFIANIYRNAAQEDMVQLWLGKAVVFYKGIAEDKEKNDFIRITAYQTLVTAYIAQEKWNDVLTVSKLILNTFADSNVITLQRLRVITRTLNIVAVARLNDFDAAKQIYSDFIKDHSGHFLNQYLEKVIESLDLLKESKAKELAPQT